MASTVLPNGIIVPEKFSRDWYADLYHNWQELDNLLGGGGGGANDGTLTIQKNGDTVGTFSANQATDETVNIEVPDVNNGTLTIQQNGTTVDTFTANSSSDKTVNIQCVDLNNNQTVGGIKTFSNAPVVGSINLDGKTIDTDDNGDMTFNGNKVLTSADLLPIGSYIQFAGSQAPAGFLVCNGGEISRTTYSALFAVIGTTYGSGDGSTTFNLPNLIDRFLQGSTTSGTVKDAGLPNITGELSAVPRNIGDKRVDTVYARAGAFSYAGSDPWFYELNSNPVNQYSWHRIKLDASSSSSIYGNSTTVQPPALTCLICIKY